MASRPDRSLLDLLPEKRLVAHRLFTSLAGGYRLLYDQEDTQSFVHWKAHGGQILQLLFIPIWSQIVISIIPEQRLLGCLLAAALPTLVNAVCMGVSSAVFEDSPEEDDDPESLMNPKNFKFLFPCRQPAEQLFCSAVTFSNVAALAFMFNEETLSKAPVDPLNEAFGRIGAYLASFSVFSRGCPEFTTFTNSPSVWERYQRPVYNILIGALALALEPTEFCASSNYGLLYMALAIAYVLQVLAILPSPRTLALWVAEQANIWLLGSTCKASEQRTYASLIINSIIILILHWLVSEMQRNFRLMIITVLAFASAQNYLGIAFLKGDSPTATQKPEKQELWKDLNFSSKQTALTTKSATKPALNLFLTGASLSLMIIIVLMATPDEADPETFVGIQVGLAIALACCQWLLSVSSRTSVSRVLTCTHQTPDSFNVLFGRISRYLAIILLSSAYLNFEIETDLGDYNHFALTLFTFRAFARLCNRPFTASIESLALVFFPNDPLALALVAFALNRLKILKRKCSYVLASVIASAQSDGTYVQGQELCLMLTCTVLLPITAVAIAVTALLDSPTVPLLGFPFFVIGFPRLQRQLNDEVRSQIEIVEEDGREGHLYKAMLKQINDEIQWLVSSDPFMLDEGSTFLLHNSERCLFLQILERGNNFVVYQLKGIRFLNQSPAYLEEAAEVNKISDFVFRKRSGPLPFEVALWPLRSVNLKFHEEELQDVEHVVRNPHFKTLTKKAFMRIAILLLKKAHKQNKDFKLYPIFQAHLTPQQVEDACQYLDFQWFNYLHLGTLPLVMEGRQKEGEIANTDQVSPSKPLRTVLLNDEEKQLTVQINRPNIQSLDLENGRKQEKQNLVPVVESSLPPIHPRGSNMTLQQNAREHIDALQDLEMVLVDLEEKVSDHDDFEGGGSDNFDFDDLEKGGDEIQNSNIEFSIDEMFGYDDKHVAGDGSKQQIALDIFIEEATPHRDRAFRVPDPTASTAQTFMQQHPHKHVGDGSRHSSYLADFNSKRGSISSMRRKKGELTDIEFFTVQAYHLMFSDTLATFPEKLQRIFEGEFNRNFDNREFIDDSKDSFVRLRYMLIRAGRLAIHYAIDAYLMEERDLIDVNVFENLIHQTDKDWFISSEPSLWIEAIHQRLPNLERLITIQGKMILNKLRYGSGTLSEFRMFEIRREAVRGAWANQLFEEALLGERHKTYSGRFSLMGSGSQLRQTLNQVRCSAVFNSGGIITLY